MRPNPASRLSPSRRDDLVRRLDGSTFDVVVIGGGVTGAGTALDLAARGRSVLLVERADLASGTSSRSSKLIHGGLRYLEQLDAKLVSEALRERGLLSSTICPHLVRPQTFLYPLEHRGWERLYVGAGIGLYDVLAKVGGDRLPWHHHYTLEGTQQRFPSLDTTHLVGSIQYSDAQLDDARHTMAVARTAAAVGAEVLTSADVVGLVGVDEGRVRGVVVRDLETGEPATVNAAVVVNATGVWAERTERLAGAPGLSVRASKGVHIVVPGDRIQGTGAVITRAGKSVLFVLPWAGRWILGTTDTDWNHDLGRPSVSGRDVDYLLEHANRVLTSELTRDDVLSTFVGLRPLIAGNEASTAKLSREHATVQPMPGLVSIAGGKYTTYRVMAEDAGDAALEVIRAHGPASRTAELPLIGAAGWGALREDDSPMRERFGVDADGSARLLERYGGGVSELEALLDENDGWRAPVPGADGHLAVEFVHAARHEGVRHLEDALRRRTRLGFEVADRGVAAAPGVAALLAPELGWSADRERLEVAHYTAMVEAERAGEETFDDASADARRTAAPDIRTAAFA